MKINASKRFIYTVMTLLIATGKISRSKRLSRLECVRTVCTYSPYLKGN